MTNVDEKVPFEVIVIGSGLVINVPADCVSGVFLNMAAVAVPG
jgi:hypothetical protein